MAVPAVTTQEFEEISNAIAQERKRRGWSQQQLADHAGLHLTTVHFLEHPNSRQGPTLTTVLLAMEALGMSLRPVFVKHGYEAVCKVCGQKEAR